MLLTKTHIQKSLNNKAQSAVELTQGTFLHKQAGEILVETKQSINAFGHAIENRFKTTLLGADKAILSGEEKYINPLTKEMFEFDIETKRRYRDSGLRFGELLRAGSILEMLQNKIEKFSLMSTQNAVYFHSKYKFVPQIQSFDQRDSIIKMVMNEKHPLLADLKFEAQRLKEYVSDNGNNPPELRAATRASGELARKYIKRVFEWKLPLSEHPITSTMDMVLTKDNLLKNKNFFTELLERYNINHEI